MSLALLKLVDVLKRRRWMVLEGLQRVRPRAIQHVVRALPLSEVLDQYAPSQHVDLLSVDAEGLDLMVLQSLDSQRQRPTAICVEDGAAYNLGVSGEPQFNAIRAFLHKRHYCLVSQALVSFVYVDRHAIGQTEPASGFRLNDSWVEWLARGNFNANQSADPSKATIPLNQNNAPMDADSFGLQ